MRAVHAVGRLYLLWSTCAQAQCQGVKFEAISVAGIGFGVGVLNGERPGGPRARLFLEVAAWEKCNFGQGPLPTPVAGLELGLRGVPGRGVHGEVSGRAGVAVQVFTMLGSIKLAELRVVGGPTSGCQTWTSR